MYGNDVFDGFNFKATCAFVIRKKIPKSFSFTVLVVTTRALLYRAQKVTKTKQKTDHIPSDWF